MKPVNALWTNFFKGRPGNRHDACDLLRGIPLFSELHRHELRQIELLVHQRDYRDGEVVFWENDPGVAMYIVQHGNVVFYRDFTKPGQREVDRLGPNDFFGEMALLAGDFRQATAVAAGETRLHSLIHPELFDLFERKPHLGVKLLSFLATIVAQRLRRSEQNMERLMSRPAGAS